MEQLELLLFQFLMPDNDARKNAEEQIKHLARDPELVPALLHQIRNARSANVRQLAAVLLRKKIVGLWMKLNPQLHASLKNLLLESITLDNSLAVRRASADVVSALAKQDVPAGNWPELLPFLFQCSQSLQEDHREVALVLFSSLTETIGEILRPHFATLHAIFLNGLRDQSAKVRVAALKAGGTLVGYIESEDEVRMMRELIAPILDVSRYCLETGSEDVAVLAFEIFDELIESPVSLLGQSIPVIVHFALEVALNSKWEQSTRYQALQTISWLAKYKPKTLVKHKLVPAIISSMCQILSEEDFELDEYSVSADRAAAEVLDTMALHLINKHVFPHVFSFALSNFQRSEYSIREAAVMSLGIIAEGCYEIMRSNLTDILNLVLQAFEDQEKAVRGAAGFTIGQFAEHLQPEIVLHYERVLPCIFKVLTDPNAEVQEKAYYALAAFCEHLGSEILPFLPVLMERLVATLQCSRRDLQETCMSAICSTAAAAQSAFIPYAPGVLELMKSFLVLTADEDLPARARATELVGIIGTAVGRQYIEPVLPSFVEAAISGFSLDYTELREYSHGFFSSVAEILEGDLEQYLPRLVPLAYATCDLDDGTTVDFEVENEDGEFGDVSSDDGDDNNQNLRNVSIRTGVLDEKAAATQALGAFALHSKGAFMPYLEATLKILRKHSMYFHEDVRLQAFIALQHMLTATQATFPNTDTISAQAKHVLGVVMELYLMCLKSDSDKDTVAQVCTCLAEIYRHQDAKAMEPFFLLTSEEVLKLLRQEATCQRTDDTDDEDDGQLDTDQALMDAVADVLPAMATCMGPSFEPIFSQHFEALMKFSKESRAANDRTMVIGCVAEIARAIGSQIIPYIPRVMPVALQELRSAEAANRRNAAYCVGQLCKNGGVKAEEFYGSALAALHPLFSEGEEDVVRDNAAGAVARMITTQSQALPLSQVLPVLVRALPVKADLEEATAVYTCLSNLILASQPEILPLVPQVLPIFAKVAASTDELPEEAKVLIGRAVAHLLSHYRDEMQPLLSNIPADQANALAAIVRKI
ncbi:importin-4 isoform X1 [Selaginella moellendorffii]|uniref:importin-4 isoform X1 n=2 Tax=Selaginella moellendorffii TaxID=88036 RepID=UPI000D1C3508|nr:importin-4 isoform X1 [Selaginella moellendorffii]|eukprot:XP_024542572.1 importin-4 isoform X1 [Selaginella moellendorffii]